MGMCSVGPGPSDLVVEVEVVADNDVVSVDVVADVVVSDSVAVVDDGVGISCIFTLFTVSMSSSSMVQMKSYCSGSLVFALDSGIDLDSVAAELSVVVVCSAAESVVVVAYLMSLVVALSAAMVVSVQALWQLVVDG